MRDLTVIMKNCLWNIRKETKTLLLRTLLVANLISVYLFKYFLKSKSKFFQASTFSNLMINQTFFVENVTVDITIGRIH